MNNNILIAEKSLKKNGFQVKTFDNAKEAMETLMEAISTDESVAFGGSMTLSGLEIYEDLKKRGHETYWHWKGEDRKKN